MDSLYQSKGLSSCEGRVARLLNVSIRRYLVHTNLFDYLRWFLYHIYLSKWKISLIVSIILHYPQPFHPRFSFGKNTRLSITKCVYVLHKNWWDPTNLYNRIDRMDHGRPYRCIDLLSMSRNICSNLIPLNSLYGIHDKVVIIVGSGGLALSDLLDLFINHTSYDINKLLRNLICDIMYSYFQLWYMKYRIITTSSSHGTKSTSNSSGMRYKCWNSLWF